MGGLGEVNILRWREGVWWGARWWIGCGGCMGDMYQLAQER